MHLEAIWKKVKLLYEITDYLRKCKQHDWRYNTNHGEWIIFITEQNENATTPSSFQRFLQSFTSINVAVFPYYHPKCLSRAAMFFCSCFMLTLCWGSIVMVLFKLLSLDTIFWMWCLLPHIFLYFLKMDCRKQKNSPSQEFWEPIFLCFVWLYKFSAS